MNLIIYKNNVIKYFIKDCKKQGTSYVGVNMRLDGFKSNGFEFKWTLQEPTPIYKEGVLVGYKELASEIKKAPEFLKQNVGSLKEVDNIIKAEISKKYDVEDEIKLIRRKDKEFKVYNDFVEKLVKKGKVFKKKHFKEGSVG